MEKAVLIFNTAGICIVHSFLPGNVLAIQYRILNSLNLCYATIWPLHSSNESCAHAGREWSFNIHVLFTTWRYVDHMVRNLLVSHRVYGHWVPTIRPFTWEAYTVYQINSMTICISMYDTLYGHACRHMQKFMLTYIAIVYATIM